jgi:molecular chaperone Hsp33
MYDRILRAVVEGAELRIALVVSTEAVREAKRRHGLDPLVTTALGRALTCAALLSATLKEKDDFVHLTLKGDGPLRGLATEATGRGFVRGFPYEKQVIQVQPVPQTVSEALGQGIIEVRRGGPKVSMPYTGVCRLETGEVASDVARYLLDSEQIYSSVSAGVILDQDGEVRAAGGFLVQKLPASPLTEGQLKDLEERIRERANISKAISEGKEPEDTLQAVLSPLKHKFLREDLLTFFCGCKRERMAEYLTSLSQQEIMSIFHTVGKLEVICHYCSSIYTYEPDEILRLKTN